VHITFLFYEGMTALDAIGPYEVLSRLPDTSVHSVSLKPGAIHTSSGLVLHAKNGLSDISQTDILVVPGSGYATSLNQFPEVLEWIQTINETTSWTTSVCTGSLILGAAKLLLGVRATTHWAVMDRLSQWGAIPTEKRVVESGKIITAAGVSAGIDMALMLAEKVAGKDVAETLQLGIEYDPKPPFDAGSIKKARPIIVTALREKLMKKFEKGPLLTNNKPSSQSS